uniref:Ref family recombination enhancement nuclease n=1 Tax=Castellaniella defragrans TaxID=75697 RepID=UPI0033400FE1
MSVFCDFHVAINAAVDGCDFRLGVPGVGMLVHSEGGVMRAFNSTLKPGKPMQRKTPMRSGKPMVRGRQKRSGKPCGMTAIERRFLDAIAAQGCILCRRLGYPGTPAEIHHLRAGMGAGQRNSNQNVIPLCPEHHRGNTGYHGLGRRAFERMYGVTELDLWEMTQKNNPATVGAVPGFSVVQA